MEYPSYIQKMLDEYNAKNPPLVLNEKRYLKHEIIEVLNSLNNRTEPVFKEFVDNPLAAKSEIELKQEIKSFINTVNSNDDLCEATKSLILNFSNMFIYNSFCGMENVLRNKNVNFYDTMIYDFIVEDLVNSCYNVKKNMDISIKDLLTYTYYLGFKDYVATFYLPIFNHLTTHKLKSHLNILKHKKNPLYRHFQNQKDFILNDENLSRMYKYFAKAYGNKYYVSSLNY